MKPSLLFILLAGLFAGCATQRGFQTPLPNYDHVDSEVRRGGQPNRLGIYRLKADDTASVLNLRGSDAWPGERLACIDVDILYLNVPMSGICPSQDELEMAVEALNQLPKPCFVHCQWGCERTGLVIACRRILQGWTVEAAWREAKIYGCSSVAGMKQALIRFKENHDHLKLSNNPIRH